MTKIPSNYIHQKKIWGFGGLIAGLLSVYVLLVGFTVWNTLIRQRSEKQVTSIQANISELEFSYVNLKSSINVEMATELGFVSSPEFTIAKGSADVALLR